MTTKERVQQIRETQERIRRQIRLSGWPHTPKMAIIDENLARHYAQERAELLRTGSYEPLAAEVHVHRVAVTSETISWEQFEKLPGAHVLAPEHLWKQTYMKVRRVRFASGNVREIVVEYDRTVGFVDPYRVTIIPRHDRLEFGDLQSVLELLPTFKFSIVEFAIDFPIRSIIDLKYVQQHALFGKMQPGFVGINPLHDTRGSRRGGIFQRVYARFETEALRVEFEFHTRFLRRHQINTMENLRRLAQIVRDRLIFFGQLDEQKLDEQLRRNGLSQRRRHNILEQVRDKAEDLSAVMRYLRRRVGVTNGRRLLIPLPVNQIVREALEQWSKQWVASPARSGKT